MAVVVQSFYAMLLFTLIVKDTTGSAFFPKAFKPHPRQSAFDFADSYVPEEAETDSSKPNVKFPLFENGRTSRLFKRSRNNKNEEKLQDFLSYNNIDSSGPFPYKFLEGSGVNDQEETQDYFNDGIDQPYDEYMDTSSEVGQGIQEYYNYNYHGMDKTFDDYIYTSTESPQENGNDWRYYADFSGDCSDDNEDFESNSLDNSKEMIGESFGVHGSHKPDDSNHKNRIGAKSRENDSGHIETQDSSHDDTSTAMHNKNMQNKSDVESRIFSRNDESEKADSGNELTYLIVGISIGVLILVFMLVLAFIYWRRRQKRLNVKRVYADRKPQEETHGLMSTSAHPIYNPKTRSKDHTMDTAKKPLQNEEHPESIV